MTAITSSGLPNWQAAGVRHAVLLRVLPVLSHDLATPITVLRMTAMVLRRKLATGPADVEYCVERLAALEQQADALTRTLKLLGGWGLGAADAVRVSRPSLVTGCIALLQPLLRMRGIRLEMDPALHSEGEIDAQAQAQSLMQTSQPRWPRASSLRYLLLASICYLQDAQIHLERIEIRPDGDDALRLIPFLHQPLSHSRDAIDGDDALRFDTAALECLASDLGHSVRLNPDGVWLHLGAAA